MLINTEAIESKSLQDTKKAAIFYAKTFANKGQCFALCGDLGSGKTTFTSFFIKALNSDIKNVSSPTFTIIQIYESIFAPIWHLDCYRLKHKDEFLELGMDEMFADIVSIIEWPEMIKDHLPKNTIFLNFQILSNNNILIKML